MLYETYETGKRRVESKKKIKFIWGFFIHLDKLGQDK